jgi:hypothetical protein
MRRGFYGWTETELPLSALEARAARVQAALKAEGLDGLLLYTNIARPAAVSWLTGFTPYWSEGLLFVPLSGQPDFATALSKRVGEWMRSVTPTGSILNTPQPAAFFGKKLAASGAKRLGVLELDMMPGAQAQALLDAAPGLDLVDATALYRKLRVSRDAAELALFREAARLAEEGLAHVVPGEGADAYAHIGQVEKLARDGRAEEVFVTLAPDLTKASRFLRVDRAGAVAASFAVRSSVAYKSTWVRRTRSVSSDAGVAARFAAAAQTVTSLVAKLDGTRPLAAQIDAGVAPLPGVKVQSWALEACRGSYPLEIVAGTGASDDAPGALAGSLLTVTLDLGGIAYVDSRPILPA